MPFTTAQLTTGATYTLNTYERTDPVDQINDKHVALDWLIKNRESADFGNGYLKLPLYYSNDGNYQNYFGADQVTYNERDPAKWAEFAHFNHFAGFWFDEDRLAANGIHISDDGDTMPTRDEQSRLINLLKTSYRALKNDIQTGLAYEMYRDGSQSTKACPGIEHIVDWTPAVGTVGGINAATFTWWQNNASTSISADTNLLAGTQQMEVMWRNCMRYGGMVPNKIVAGSAFIDSYRKNAGSTVSRQINSATLEKGGVSLDPSVTNLYFHGVPVEWDPTLDALDTLLSTSTRSKTCYFLNSEAIKLRPMNGEWMRNRKPKNLPDRFVTYFGQTSKYGLVTNKRSALAILQIS